MSRVRLFNLGVVFLMALGAIQWITRRPPAPAEPAAAQKSDDDAREEARKRLKSLGYLN